MKQDWIRSATVLIENGANPHIMIVLFFFLEYGLILFLQDGRKWYESIVSDEGRTQAIAVNIFIFV